MIIDPVLYRLICLAVVALLLLATLLVVSVASRYTQCPHSGRTSNRSRGQRMSSQRHGARR